MMKFLKLKRYLKNQNAKIGEISPEQLEKLTGIKIEDGIIKKDVYRKFSRCGYHVSFNKDTNSVIYVDKEMKESFCSK